MNKCVYEILINFIISFIFNSLCFYGTACRSLACYAIFLDKHALLKRFLVFSLIKLRNSMIFIAFIL